MGAADQCHIFVRLRPQRRSASTLKTKDRHHTTSYALCQAGKRKISANFVPGGFIDSSPIFLGGCRLQSRGLSDRTCRRYTRQGFRAFSNNRIGFCDQGCRREVAGQTPTFADLCRPLPTLADFSDWRDIIAGQPPASGSDPHAPACPRDDLRGFDCACRRSIRCLVSLERDHQDPAAGAG